MQLEDLDVAAERLGVGGLSSVHVAIHKGKAVAAKLWRHQDFLETGQEARDREALQTEAAIMHRLQHPHIAQVVALVMDNDRTAGYAMEILGLSLRAAAERSCLAPPLLGKTLKHACLAMAYVHQALVAHTDLKEENLLLTVRHDAL